MTTKKLTPTQLISKTKKFFINKLIITINKILKNIFYCKTTKFLNIFSM